MTKKFDIFKSQTAIRLALNEVECFNVSWEDVWKYVDSLFPREEWGFDTYDMAQIGEQDGRIFLFVDNPKTKAKTGS